MKFTTLIAALIGALFLSGPGELLRARPLSDFWEIDSYIQTQMEEADIPGAALAIVKGDTVLYLMGYGQTGPSGSPVTPQTPFMLGSTGKSITALAIMQLVENGSIQPDSPVITYLPWFRTADAAASNRITVRHLLTHTSGISSSTGLKQMSDGDTTGYAIEKQVRNLSDTKLTAAPGTVFQYSNANFIILGMIIQTVTGRSYDEYIRGHIFDPLEMKQCFTSRNPALKSGLATAHRKWFGQSLPAAELPFVRGALSAGYQMCPARDMAHYLIAQLNGGRYRGKTVLSEANMAELHRPDAEAPGRGHYAMGWTVTKLDDTPVVAHGGAAPGYLSDLILVPTERLGVVLLTNTYTPLFSRQQMQIADNVTRILLGRSPVPNSADYISGAVLAGISLILILQIFTAIRTLIRPNRPTVLGLLVNAGWALFVFLAIPEIFQLPWSVILLFQPDVGWLAIVSGSIATIRGVARAGFSLSLTLFKNPASGLPSDETFQPGTEPFTNPNF